MNYQAIYDVLITRAKTRQLLGYSEKHHILPRCMGGTDDTINLVDLTPEEHFLCHQLLAKIHKDSEFASKLIFSCHMMTIKTKATDGRNLSKLKRFGWLKREYAIACSKRLTGRKLSDSTKEKLSLAHRGKKKSESALTAMKAAGKLRIGEKHSSETKLKMSISRLARTTSILHTQESKDSISKAKSGISWSEARRLAQTKLKNKENN